MCYIIHSIILTSVLLSSSIISRNGSRMGSGLAGGSPHSNRDKIKPGRAVLTEVTKRMNAAGWSYSYDAIK